MTMHLVKKIISLIDGILTLLRLDLWISGLSLEQQEEKQDHLYRKSGSYTGASMNALWW